MEEHDGRPPMTSACAGGCGARVPWDALGAVFLGAAIRPSCESCEAKERAAILVRVAAKAGIPERWTEKLGSMGPEDANVEDFVVFVGGAGTGKTHDAIRHALHLVLRGEKVRFVEWDGFLEERKGSMRDGDNARPVDPMEDAKRFRGTLILDDLGSEGAGRKPSPYAVESANVLLGYRYAHKLRTLITTNLTGAQIEAIYGERLASRLCEAATWVTKSGRDRRRGDRRSAA